MMRIPESDRSKAESGISSIREFMGLVFVPDKSRNLLFLKRTCTSLQSLMKVLVHASCFVLFAVHYCALHTQDVLSYIPSDTREQDEYPAIVYCEPAERNGTLHFYWLLTYWLYIDEYFDRPWKNKTSDSCFGD